MRRLITKIFLVLAVSAGLPLGARGAEMSETDSISAALAASIGSYFKQSVDTQYPAGSGERQLFAEAVVKAITADKRQRAEYDGYAEGLKLADNLERLRGMGFEVSNAVFAKELANVLAGREGTWTREQAEEFLSAYEQRRKSAEASAQQAFLDAQAAREGVTKLPSGLLFEVITEGEGESPKLTDKVEVYYTGRLADGTVFDGTTDTPAVFPVNRLIPGFTEGLTMMKPGGTYRLYIPSELGYGDRGAGSQIPGGAALDFTVTLVGVK